MSNTEILKEQFFPSFYMSKEERDFYLNILENCKDICDTENTVDGSNKCKILEATLEKNEEKNKVDINGSLVIGSDNKHENRWINATIYFENDCILVDTKITRLNENCENKVYTVLDVFRLENGILKRKSQYNYNMKSVIEEIENEEMKGRLK